jgi:hypothetical protein
MIDFMKVRDECFGNLSATNQVAVPSNAEKEQLGLAHFETVWETKTAIFNLQDEAMEITIHLCLPADFPLVLPVIFLSPGDYDNLKYLANVNEQREICLFNNEGVQPDYSRPEEILRECLKKARETLENGLSQKEHFDFEEEFNAYWEEKYDPADERISYLCMLSAAAAPETSIVPYYWLNEPFNGYFLVIHDGQPEALSLKDYFSGLSITFTEGNAFYLGTVRQLRPSFFFTNDRLWQLVQSQFPEKVKSFRKYLNGTYSYPRIVLFSRLVEGRHLYFGFLLNPLPPPSAGYRQESVRPFDVFIKFKKTEPLKRLCPDVLTTERLISRTTGEGSSGQAISLLVAGLGSIGSNLLPYLLSLDVRQISLVDPDILAIENINRHLLGFSDVGEYKVMALKNNLTDKNPLLTVEAFVESIIEMIRHNSAVLRQADYVVVAIGKDSIEDYIISQLKTGQIDRPTIIFWVEPFLIGGHCLTLVPNVPLTVPLREGNFYQFNVIAREEYTSPSRQFFFKESGCQTSYIPYGQKNITLFLSAIFPFIAQFIDSTNKRNCALTWRGNPEIQEQQNIRLSSFGSGMSPGQVSKTEL